jgi:hypothetical protein
VAELCLPLLGVLFLQKLIDAREEIAKEIKPLLIITGVLAFILLAMGIAPGAFNSFLTTGEQTALEEMPAGPMLDYYSVYFEELAGARKAVFTGDVWRSFAFLVLAGGALFAYLKNMFSTMVLGSIMLVMVLTDLIFVDTRYLGTEKTGKNFKQWTENFKAKYPYTILEGESQILQMELQENPQLAEKIDSAMAVLQSKESYSGKDISGAERQRLADWLTFRTLNRYTNFRVYEEGDPFNSTYVSYFNKSIGGYHGAKLSRYQDLIEFHIARQNPAVMDMLNTKYYLRPIYNQKRVLENSIVTKRNKTALGNAWLTKKVKEVPGPNEEILALQNEYVYNLVPFVEHEIMVNGKVDTLAVVNDGQDVKFLFHFGVDSTGKEVVDTIDLNPSPDQQNPNPYAIPFAAVSDDTPLALVFVAPKDGQDAQIRWDYAFNVNQDNRPLLGVNSAGRSGWEPLKETVVDQKFKSNISQTEYSGEGKIEMTSYHPDHLTYSFSSPEKQLVVFSEIYYPVGWKAYVDNVEVPISCVNYVLRAVEVPAGDHKVELVYTVSSDGKAITYIYSASVLMLLLFGGGIFLQRKIDQGETKPNAA